jgi:hypothetical protein
VVTSYVPAPFDGSQSCFNALGVDATSVYWTGTNAAWGAKHVFSAVDHYVWWAIYRWLSWDPNGDTTAGLHMVSSRGPCRA